jgi:hypothetical protein
MGVVGFLGFMGAPVLTLWCLQVARGGASPPWRDDDRDGHYVFDLGENLNRRCERHPVPVSWLAERRFVCS